MEFVAAGDLFTDFHFPNPFVVEPWKEYIDMEEMLPKAQSEAQALQEQICPSVHLMNSRTGALWSSPAGTKGHVRNQNGACTKDSPIPPPAPRSQRSSRE